MISWPLTPVDDIMATMSEVIESNVNSILVIA
jgi:hypothetical protein